MKKIVFALLMLVAFGFTANATLVDNQEISYTMDVNFRYRQRLRSSDGFELYINTDHTVNMYDDEGSPCGSGTWKILGGEIYFYAHSGSLIAKCEYKISGMDLAWVKFKGRMYHKRN